MSWFCELCGEPVDPNGHMTWHRVIGWERRAGVRASGKQGGSDIALRERYGDVFAHDHCIQLARKGLLQQEALL